MAAPKNTPAETPVFEPSRHLRKLNGNDYLDVKWRILWCRTDHPTAAIETECISFNETFAIFKAVVTLPNGAIGTGWGSEEKAHFKDYIEKAETKALGRALGVLGYGTQFADDFADGGTNSIADAPVQRPAQRNAPHTQIDGQALKDRIVSESHDREAQREDKRDYTPIFVAGKNKGLKPEDVKAIAYKQHQVTSMTALTGEQLFTFNAYLNNTDPEELAEAAFAATTGAKQ